MQETAYRYSANARLTVGEIVRPGRSRTDIERDLVNHGYLLSPSDNVLNRIGG